ncbi:MAG: hypothetical protein RR326_11970, partial [Stenotrophomonas sp.]
VTAIGGVGASIRLRDRIPTLGEVPAEIVNCRPFDAAMHVMPRLPRLAFRIDHAGLPRMLLDWLVKQTVIAMEGTNPFTGKTDQHTHQGVCRFRDQSEYFLLVWKLGYVNPEQKIPHQVNALPELLPPGFPKIADLTALGGWHSIP